jgi:hypothetical protein
MSGSLQALLVGTGFFLTINLLFWGVWLMVERIMDSRL